MINYDVAYKYIGKNKNLYMTIAKSFLESYKDFEQKIHHVDNLDEIHLLVHSLKGITLNLGMVKLYNECDILINSLYKGNYNLNKFFIVFKKTYKQLLDYFLTTNESINSLVGSI